MEEKGFVRLSRKFFTNEFWMEARTYSACEAWLDLIQSARFEASPRTGSIGGREITWERGQYPASIRFLSRKWSWSERSVRTFLDKLKKRRMITTDSQSQGINIITLCKYNEYNPIGTANNTPVDTDNNKEIRELKELVTQLMTHQQTQERHNSDTNNKKEKEYKEISNTSNEVSDTKKKTLFKNYINWQIENCPNVSQMDKQITETEFTKIMQKYSPKQIKTVIQSMENSKGNNNKPVYKRYISVYLTFLNWAKKEYGNE